MFSSWKMRYSGNYLYSGKNSVQTLIWYWVDTNYSQTSNTYSRQKYAPISDRRRWIQDASPNKKQNFLLNLLCKQFSCMMNSWFNWIIHIEYWIHFSSDDWSIKFNTNFGKTFLLELRETVRQVESKQQLLLAKMNHGI